MRTRLPLILPDSLSILRGTLTIRMVQSRVVDNRCRTLHMAELLGAQQVRVFHKSPHPRAPHLRVVPSTPRRREAMLPGAQLVRVFHRSPRLRAPHLRTLPSTPRRREAMLTYNHSIMFQRHLKPCRPKILSVSMMPPTHHHRTIPIKQTPPRQCRLKMPSRLLGLGSQQQSVLCSGHLGSHSPRVILSRVRLSTNCLRVARTKET